MLEIEDNSIVQIVCKNADQKKDLIELITGAQVKRGVCVLGAVDTKQHLDAYRRKIDVIDIGRVESTLNVRNYLAFYTMVMGIYHEKTMEEITNFFVQIGIVALLDKPLNELSKEDKIKVRCLASYLKQVNCLVGKDMLEDLEPKQKEGVISFLQEHFRNHQCLCLLFENDSQQEKNVDAVFVI